MNIKQVGIGAALSVAGFFLVLILSVVLFGRTSGWLDVLTSERLLYSLRLSLVTATSASALAIVVAVPAAYALSRYDFFGKSLVDTITELPLILSPVALGAVLLIFFSTSAGTAIQEHGIRFVFEIAGIILAQFVSIVGVAIRLIKAAFDEVPRRLEDVARSLGAGPTRAFGDVTLPLARKGLLAAGLLTWAKAVGEFGATITVAGSMAMKTETLPISIFNALSGSEIDKAVVLILILAVFGVSVLYVARVFLGTEPYDLR